MSNYEKLLEAEKKYLISLKYVEEKPGYWREPEISESAYRRHEDNGGPSKPRLLSQGHAVNSARLNYSNAVNGEEGITDVGHLVHAQTEYLLAAGWLPDPTITGSWVRKDAKRSFHFRKAVNHQKERDEFARQRLEKHGG